ncbi:hypothetical protein GOODEAATRI_020295 [Goodea atripinnis]|uniref:Uncharacterized protein n=1 Tax=Goodea atripinnis TaxID=208336 RepID=A0ABV0PZM1_9TELE
MNVNAFVFAGGYTEVGDVEVTQDPSVDSTVLPPGTYVKVSGNLRSFQPGIGGGMGASSTSMVRQGLGITGGSYAGANENPLMVINGLSANQNQVVRTNRVSAFRT